MAPELFDFGLVAESVDLNEALKKRALDPAVTLFDSDDIQYDKETDCFYLLGHFYRESAANSFAFETLKAEHGRMTLQEHDPALEKILATQAEKGRQPTSFDFINNTIVMAEGIGPEYQKGHGFLASYDRQGNLVKDMPLPPFSKPTLVRRTGDIVIVNYHTFDSAAQSHNAVEWTVAVLGLDLAEKEKHAAKQCQHVAVDKNGNYLLLEKTGPEENINDYKFPTGQTVSIIPLGRSFLDSQGRLYNIFSDKFRVYDKNGVLLHESEQHFMYYAQRVVALDDQNIVIAGYNTRSEGPSPTLSDVRVKQVILTGKR